MIFSISWKFWIEEGGRRWWRKRKIELLLPSTELIQHFTIKSFVLVSRLHFAAREPLSSSPLAGRPVLFHCFAFALSRVFTAKCTPRTNWAPTQSTKTITAQLYRTTEFCCSSTKREQPHSYFLKVTFLWLCPRYHHVRIS